MSDTAPLLSEMDDDTLAATARMTASVVASDTALSFAPQALADLLRELAARVEATDD